MWIEPEDRTPSRMPPGEVVLNYPHYAGSFEPRPMRAPEIWRVAETARSQICLHPRRPKVELAQIVSRCRRLRINGVPVRAHWEYGEAVHDESGAPALGVTEHRADCPDTATIFVNGDLIGERDHLVRSTTVHELGHAVFDTPAWIRRSRQLELELPDRPSPERRFQVAAPPERTGRDWREWRANEFMGAFLVPRDLVHARMVRTAASLECPLVAGPVDQELPILDTSAGHDLVHMAVVIELADQFGVSDAFMEVRLRKYGLVRGMSLAESFAAISGRPERLAWAAG